MKKLLILMLVLGLASVANALVLKISVNGDVDPQDTTINIEPSDYLTLDIWCTSGHDGSGADDQYWALVCDTAYGTIDWTTGWMKAPPAPSLSSYDSLTMGSAAANGIPGLLPGEDGAWGNIASAPNETAPPGQYFDGIIFHCEALNGDTIIRLISTPDFENYFVQDTQIIHQIPEPASMLLLGLGGLLLRRRK